LDYVIKKIWAKKVNENSARIISRESIEVLDFLIDAYPYKK
jgi:hypothetical protein